MLVMRIDWLHTYVRLLSKVFAFFVSVLCLSLLTVGHDMYNSYQSVYVVLNSVQSAVHIIIPPLHTIYMPTTGLEYKK